MFGVKKKKVPNWTFNWFEVLLGGCLFARLSTKRSFVFKLKLVTSGVFEHISFHAELIDFPLKQQYSWVYDAVVTDRETQALTV